jgi:hypothetical protein
MYLEETGLDSVDYIHGSGWEYLQTSENTEMNLWVP